MDSNRVAMNLVDGYLVATLQVDLNRHVLDAFQEGVLQRVKTTGARGLILDCSALALIDSEDFAHLKRTTAMAALMGTESVFVGLSPGIVSSLVELGVDLDGVQGALTLEDAFALCRASASEPSLPAGEPPKGRP